MVEICRLFCYSGYTLTVSVMVEIVYLLWWRYILLLLLLLLQTASVMVEIRKLYLIWYRYADCTSYGGDTQTVPLMVEIHRLCFLMILIMAAVTRYPMDAGCLCDKAAVLWDTTKTHPVECGYTT